MSRDEMIEQLKKISPAVTYVTCTSDMGYEFAAILPTGVIYPEPGMLLSYSDGEWPPNSWVDKTESEIEKLLAEFLSDDIWEVIPWESLEDEELENWFDDAVNINLDD